MFIFLHIFQTEHTTKWKVMIFHFTVTGLILKVLILTAALWCVVHTQAAAVRSAHSRRHPSCGIVSRWAQDNENGGLGGYQTVRADSCVCRRAAWQFPKVPKYAKGDPS